MKNDDTNQQDKILGNTIIVYDKGNVSTGVFKRLKIITDNEIKLYKIRRTAKKCYLLNK